MYCTQVRTLVAAKPLQEEVHLGPLHHRVRVHSIPTATTTTTTSLATAFVHVGLAAARLTVPASER